MIDSKFGRLQCDPCLHDYVELFKCKLIAAESKAVYVFPSRDEFYKFLINMNEYDAALLIQSVQDKVRFDEHQLCGPARPDVG